MHQKLYYQLQYLLVFDGATMIIKQVKEYSNRQRIDINKSDGLSPGSEVVILSKSDYDSLNKNNRELTHKVTALSSEVEIYKDQERNLTEIVENVTAPIYENHKKELIKKDNQIKQLELQLKVMESKINQYNLELMGLNKLDIAIFGKHKKLIKNFSEDISIIGSDLEFISTEKNSIPGGNDNKNK